MSKLLIESDQCCEKKIKTGEINLRNENRTGGSVTVLKSHCFSVFYLDYNLLPMLTFWLI